MPAIVHYLNCNDPVELVALGDLHIGDSNCDMKLIQSHIDSVKTSPNRYVVLTGDIMNTAIVGSKSDTYTEDLTPQEQLDLAVKLFEPIKSKILAIVPGNHEERITRTAGIDTTKMLAHMLNLDDVYRATSALVILKFGFSYSIYINHGHGGGRRIGGKINSLEDYAKVIDADCYIVGHTHCPASFKDQHYRIVNNAGKLVERLYVNTASALKYGGYGNRGGYTPASNSYPVITFDSHKHKMTATL